MTVKQISLEQTVYIISNSTMAKSHRAVCGVSEPDEAPKLTSERAKQWAKSMQNADGSTGAHCTQEQTSQVMAQRGYHYEPEVWHAIMCAMYSDFCEVAKKYGLGGNAEFYANMAHAWLDDKDAVKDKAAAYYCYIVRR